MKKWIGWCIAAAAAWLLPCFAVSAQLSTEHDRFTGATKVSYESQLTTSNPFALSRPTFGAHATYKDGEPEHFWLMMFTASTSNSRRAGSGWQYLHVDRVNWLIDGVPLDLGPAKPNRSVQRGFVVEAFIQDLSREQLAKLGNAITVEFRIGSDEFRLSGPDVNALAALARSERPSAAGSGTPALPSSQQPAKSTSTPSPTQPDCKACAKIGGG